MCYNGKCMHCLEVETGSLIFAILNIMFTSLGSVVSVGGLVYTSFMTKVVIDRADEVEDHEMMAGALVFGLAANIVFAALSVGFCIALAFGVVLIVGLCKRKANLVKCYFVYGVTKTVIGLTTLLGLAVYSVDPVPVIFLSLFIYFFYTLILIMIRLTFKKFETEIPFHSFTNPIAVQKF